jgi:hypothetical protein
MSDETTTTQTNEPAPPSGFSGTPTPYQVAAPPQTQNEPAPPSGFSGTPVPYQSPVAEPIEKGMVSTPVPFKGLVNSLTGEQTEGVFPQWLQTGLEKTYQAGKLISNKMIEPFTKAAGEAAETVSTAALHPGEFIQHPLQTVASPELRTQTEQEHPYVMGASKATGEFAGGMVADPRNWPFLASGGLEPLFQKVVSGGFAVMMGHGTYEGAKTLIQNWDHLTPMERSEALTSTGLGAAMTTLAAHGAVGPEAKAVVGEIAKSTADVARNTVGTAKSAFGSSVDALGSLMGKAPDFETAMKRSMRVAPKQTIAMAEKIKNVMPELQAILNLDKDGQIVDPKTMADAIEKHRADQIEAPLQKAAGVTQDSTEPVVADLEQRVRAKLKNYFAENKGRFGSEDETEAATEAIVNRILQRGKQTGYDEAGRPVYAKRAPNLFEAENVRQGLNDDAAPAALGAKLTARNSGSLEAVKEVRKAVDEAYAAKGVDKVAEARKKEADLIDVRDALRANQGKAETMGDGGIFHSVMKKIGTPSMIISALLAPVTFGASIPAVGAIVLGDQLVQNLRNPNVNIARAQELAAKNPNAEATVPTVGTPPPAPEITPPEQKKAAEKAAKERQKAVEKAAKEAEKTAKETPAKTETPPKAPAGFSPLEAETAEKEGTHVVSSPAMEANAERQVTPAERFPLGHTEDSFHHHEWGHVAVAAAEGIPAHDFASHLHPEVPSNAVGGIDWRELPFAIEDNAAEKYTPEQIWDNTKSWIRTYLGGAAANELIDGLSFENNVGLKGDLRMAKGLLEEHGITGPNADLMLNKLHEEAKEHLTKPGVLDTIKENAKVREENLDPTLHASAGRVEEFQNHIRGLNENDNAATNAEARRGGGQAEGNEPRVPREGQAAGAQGRAALESKVKEEPKRFSDAAAEKYFEDQNNVAYNIVEEYRKSLDKGGKQSWSLISARRAKKIWSDYSKLGFVRDEVGINKMVETALENIHKINVNNVLTGHSQESPELFAQDLTEQKVPEGHFDKNYDFFEDENGALRISDYATEKMNAVAGRLYDAKTPEEKLQALDHLFNIVHARSDLSSWFIEGGKKSLNDIAGKEPERSMLQGTKVPSERSTGDPEADKAIRAGGGIPGGPAA